MTQTQEQVTAGRVVFFQARFSECPTIGLYASFTSIFIGHFMEFCQSRCVSSSKQSRPGNLVLLMCACTHTRGETARRGLYRKWANTELGDSGSQYSLLSTPGRLLTYFPDTPNLHLPASQGQTQLFSSVQFNSIALCSSREWTWQPVQKIGITRLLEGESLPCLQSQINNSY